MDIDNFGKTMCSKLWGSKAGQEMVHQIFKALDQNDNGIIDEEEYMAALMHLGTYIFCTKEGCPNASTHLNMLHESGYICPNCGPAYVLCHEVSCWSTYKAEHHTNSSTV
jgi:hypothetical protein